MAENKIEIPRLDVRSLPGPETIVRHTLPNGITILTRENFSSPSVVLSGYLMAGALNEAPDLAGLADLTALALMRGTETKSFQTIYESIESIGSSLGIGAGKHTASFRGKGLAEDLVLLLELLSDVLRAPSFPDEQIERMKAQRLTGIAIRDQDTGARASMAFDDLAYADHPYSVPSSGVADTVSKLSAADLRRFHQEHYGPEGMVISIVGAVNSEAVLESVAANFGDWDVENQSKVPSLPELKSFTGIQRSEIPLSGKIQSDLVMGIPGPSRFDPDYLAAYLGNNILGRFGLYGRIGDSVREAAGLAYYAYSSVGGGPGPGAWQVTAGVNPENLDRAIDLIRDEIRRFTAELVTEEEILENQANFIGKLPLQLETNEGVAGGLAHIERYQLGLDYYQRFPEKISGITREKILETARKFLDADTLAIGIAGPSTDGVES
jgi:zinc protease